VPIIQIVYESLFEGTPEAAKKSVEEKGGGVQGRERIKAPGKLKKINIY
jgi:hypothetical protein